MRKLLIFTLSILVANFGGANAAVLTFKGDGVDLPTSIINNTPCSPNDVCGTALTYNFNVSDSLSVTATANGVSDQLVVQDIDPRNSGLGVYSETDQGIYTPAIRSFDEIDAAANETLILTFNRNLTVGNFELNNGSDEDCPIVGIEGGCGSFELFVDNISVGVFAAVDVHNETYEGSIFEFAPLEGASFHLASLEVISTPAPAAWLLMATGGFFIARRKRKAA